LFNRTLNGAFAIWTRIVEGPTPGSMPTGRRSLYFFAQIEPL